MKSLSKTRHIINFKWYQCQCFSFHKVKMIFQIYIKAEWLPVDHIFNSLMPAGRWLSTAFCSVPDPTVNIKHSIKKDFLCLSTSTRNQLNNVATYKIVLFVFRHFSSMTSFFGYYLNDSITFSQFNLFS